MTQRARELLAPVYGWFTEGALLDELHTELGQFDEASRCISEALIAVQTTNESWYEADIHRIAGEIALRSPEPDVAKAEAHFERALQVALVQRAAAYWSA